MSPDAVDSTSVSHPELGAAVRARREELELRPEAVAAAAGISLATLRRVELGLDTRLGTLRSIAKALRTTVTALLGGNGEAA